MLEINKDFYCSASFNIPHKNYETGYCRALKGACGKLCSAYHRKWPTPEQFREEYGEEVPNDFPVWINGYFENGNSMYANGEYQLMEYHYAKGLIKTIKTEIKRWGILCACTPFGKPPKDWRP